MKELLQSIVTPSVSGAIVELSSPRCNPDFFRSAPEAKKTHFHDNIIVNESQAYLDGMPYRGIYVGGNE